MCVCACEWSVSLLDWREYTTVVVVADGPISSIAIRVHVFAMFILRHFAEQAVDFVLLVEIFDADAQGAGGLRRKTSRVRHKILRRDKPRTVIP